MNQTAEQIPKTALAATFIRESTGYPEYKLVQLDDGGQFRIVMELSITAGDPLGLWHVIYTREVDGVEKLLAGFVVRDDGADLDGDFETHCDELAEEARTLAAEAGAEFGGF